MFAFRSGTIQKIQMAPTELIFVVFGRGKRSIEKVNYSNLYYAIIYLMLPINDTTHFPSMIGSEGMCRFGFSPRENTRVPSC